MTIHRTKPEDAVVHYTGWLPLNDEWEVTAVPLVDAAQKDAVVFARLTYRDALAVAARLGAEIIHPEHVELLHEMAMRGEALEVPAYTGTPVAEQAPEHSLRHDAACWSALAIRHWDETMPTANIGKHWVLGAPDGRSWLMGWFVPKVEAYGSSRKGPGFIQPRPLAGSLGAHSDEHFDDGTTAVLVRRRKKMLGFLGQIGRAFASVGRMIASAFASDGADVEPLRLSHGYRCSVAELVADAKALGTWHSIENVRAGRYTPKVGDLAISARVGGDPTRGGSGHVERLTGFRASPDRWDTIGGNEMNTWIEAPLSPSDLNLRGVIEVDGRVGTLAIDVARVEMRSGIRELPGAKHNNRIQEYHAGARRGGGPMAGMPGHELEGGSVLGPQAADESPWCASAASWCTYQAAKALA